MWNRVLITAFFASIILQRLSGQLNYTVVYGELYNTPSRVKHRELNDFDRKQLLYTNGDSLSFYSMLQQKPGKKDSTVGQIPDHHSIYYFPKLERVVAENFWTKPYSLNEYIPAAYNWKLMTDTLTVAGFHCLSAVADRVTVWYCPDLPVPFGPPGYEGLPGMVLLAEDYRYNRIWKAVSIIAGAPVIVLPMAPLIGCEGCYSKMAAIKNYFRD